MSHEDLTRDEPTTSVWVLWVLGWQWMVGGVLLVAPAYLFAGLAVAAWVGAGVLAVSFLGAWLSFEASRALAADRRAHSRSLDPREAGSAISVR